MWTWCFSIFIAKKWWYHYHYILNNIILEPSVFTSLGILYMSLSLTCKYLISFSDGCFVQGYYLSLGSVPLCLVVSNIFTPEITYSYFLVLIMNATFKMQNEKKETQWWFCFESFNLVCTYNNLNPIFLILTRTFKHKALILVE